MSNYRTGIEVMNTLFDIINEIAGFTDKYYSEMENVIDHEGLREKYKKERGKNPEESEVLHSRHAHCLLAIEGIESLTNMRSSENRAKDYFDSLLMRSVSGTDYWYRNHFPIVLETSEQSFYFSYSLYN
jgi:hypothetical protein